MIWKNSKKNSEFSSFSVFEEVYQKIEEEYGGQLEENPGLKEMIYSLKEGGRELKRENQELEGEIQNLHFDGLTGLPFEEAFYDDLIGRYSEDFRKFYDALSKSKEEYREIMEKSSRTSPLSYIMIDLGKLYHINNIGSYELGDKALELLADSIENHYGREADYICRAKEASDEFKILAPNTPKEDAERLSKNVHEDLNSYGFEGLIEAHNVDREFRKAKIDPEEIYDTFDLFAYSGVYTGTEEELFRRWFSLIESAKRKDKETSGKNLNRGSFERAVKHFFEKAEKEMKKNRKQKYKEMELDERYS